MHEIVKPGVRYERRHKMASGYCPGALSFTQTPFPRGIPSTGSVILSVSQMRSHEFSGDELASSVVPPGAANASMSVAIRGSVPVPDNERVSSTGSQLRVNCDD